jgi:hypothetical protein
MGKMGPNLYKKKTIKVKIEEERMEEANNWSVITDHPLEVDPKQGNEQQNGPHDREGDERRPKHARLAGVHVRVVVSLQRRTLRKVFVCQKNKEMETRVL